jgi:hypothetical protein
MSRIIEKTNKVLVFCAKIVYIMASMQVQNNPTTQTQRPLKPSMGIRKIKAFHKDPLVQSFYNFISKHNLRKSGLKAIQNHLIKKQDKANYEDLVQ